MILLSGPTGFVGQNIVKQFSGVSTVGRRGSDYSWGDLKSVDLQGIDAFIHTSGKAHDLKGSALDEEYFNVNVGLTKTFFEAFLRSDAKVFIHFSSVKAVADEVEGVLTEEGPFTAIENAYGRSKREAEEFLLNAELPDGRKLYILRPCMIHGSGNKGNLNLLYNFVSLGIPYPLGAFQNERSFLSWHNLEFILTKLIQFQPPSGVFNVADDEFVSSARLIELIALHTYRSPRIWRVSPRVVNVLASVGTMLSLPFNMQRLEKLTENYRVDNSKIKEAIGVKKLPVPAEEGLSITFKSF